MITTVYAALLAAGWGERGRLDTEQHRRWSLFEDAVENAIATTGTYDLTQEWHAIFDASIEFLVCGEYQDLADEYDLAQAEFNA